MAYDRLIDWYITAPDFPFLPSFFPESSFFIIISPFKMDNVFK